MCKVSTIFIALSVVLDVNMRKPDSLFCKTSPSKDIWEESHGSLILTFDTKNKET